MKFDGNSTRKGKDGREVNLLQMDLLREDQSRRRGRGRIAAAALSSGNNPLLPQQTARAKEEYRGGLQDCSQVW